MWDYFRRNKQAFQQYEIYCKVALLAQIKHKFPHFCAVWILMIDACVTIFKQSFVQIGPSFKEEVGYKHTLQSLQ